MANKSRIHKLIVPLLLLLFACDRPKYIALPPHVPKLVVHGYIETGTYFDVVVGRTFPADVLPLQDETYVTDAVVVLYEDGIVRDTLDFNVNDFHYRSSHVKAIAGKTYRLTVYSPGFSPVEAVSYATLPVPTTSVRYSRRARSSMEGELLDDVSFTFTDPVNEANYYMAILKAPQNNSFCIFSYDPVVDKYQAGVNPFETGSCIDNDKVMFSDISFNGTQREVTISGNTLVLEPHRNSTTGNLIRPSLKRCNVSRELYQYIRQGASLDMYSTDPFRTPITVTSNVTGGHGLFAVYSAVVDTLR